jgi:hypothetical protein
MKDARNMRDKSATLLLPALVAWHLIWNATSRAMLIIEGPSHYRFPLKGLIS